MSTIVGQPIVIQANFQAGIAEKGVNIPGRRPGKLIGVNAYSQHPEWAAKLAEWITSESNQRLRFQMRGQGPNAGLAAMDSMDWATSTPRMGLSVLFQVQ